MRRNERDVLVQVLLAAATGGLRSLRRISLGHALEVAVVRADSQDNVAPVILQLVSEVLSASLNFEVLGFSHQSY